MTLRFVDDRNLTIGFTQEGWDAITNMLAEKRPTVIIGYSPELEALWKQDRKRFGERATAGKKCRPGSPSPVHAVASPASMDEDS